MKPLLKCKKTAPKDGLDARMRPKVDNDLIVVVSSRDQVAAVGADFVELVVLDLLDDGSVGAIPTSLDQAVPRAVRISNEVNRHVVGVVKPVTQNCASEIGGHCKPFVVGREILAGPKQQIHNGRSNRQQLSEPVGTQE